MSRASAFCPGHITGFFEIHRTGDMLSTGSRGAGLCLTLGATSRVELSESKRQSISVSINGKEQQAEVTRSALRRLLGEETADVSVKTLLDLPISQGFGMSAAGSLSAALALASLIGKSRQEAFEAAHVAEIECGCGLGDVSAIHRGGITIRKKAGLPPVGEVLRIDGAPEVALGVIGRKMLTKSVLSDPAKSKAINENGGRCVDRLLENQTLRELMTLSRSFAIDSGLATTGMVRLLDECNLVGMASMAMLGNSVFAVEESGAVERILKNHGSTWTCKVDVEGPRIL